MDIKIKGYKNLLDFDYKIEDNKLNFLFGMSGSGKSSISHALLSDKPNENITFGYNGEQIAVIDNNKEDVNNICIYNWDQKNVIFNSQNIEPFSEVMISEKDEYFKANMSIENQIKQLNAALSNTNGEYLKYSELLKDLGAKKITKSLKLPKTCSLEKVISVVSRTKNSKLYKSINEMKDGKFKWILDGMNFIDEGKCPFCSKKINKIYNSKLNKMKEFDSKSVGEIKREYPKIENILGVSLNNELKSLKELERIIIDYSIACATYEKIKAQMDSVFEDEYNANSFVAVDLTPNLKSVFPSVYNEYRKIINKHEKLVKSIELSRKNTDLLLKGKTTTVNTQFERLGIPYSFNVVRHRNGPSEYRIIHNDDTALKDDKEKLSDGEQVLISLVLFIIASSKRNKKLFIIDDPVSSYDEYRRKIIYDLMLSSYKQKTLLLLSHDSVFARYACESKHKGSRAIGNISYLYNDGKSKASLMDINQDSFARFDELLVDRYKNSTQYYQKIILLRLLFENRHRAIEYSYLSKILHGISENCMNNWLANKNKTEKLILKIINEHLANNYSIKSNYLEEMPKEYYKNIDISNYSVFEKAIITRELDKNKIIFLKPSIRNEINNYIHLGDTMVITIDVFKYPFITKNLFDVINKNPQVVSIMK